MVNLIVGQEITVNWNNQIFNAPAIVSSAKYDVHNHFGQFIVARLLTPVDLGRGYLQHTVCVRYGGKYTNPHNSVLNEATP